MLSTAPEKTLLRFRSVLAMGWLLLIGSLFWDPISPTLTAADAVHSPFRLRSEAVAVVQGQGITETPYALGNHIFWTLMVPLIPLFLMVAGHEAWRRICPLSWWSQLPRRLGWQRRTRQLNRRTGAIDRPLALVARQGWWRRHVWLIQFGLLFVALNLRLLLINADRVALGVFLLTVIGAALTVGWLWGGKTWCNAVCPIGVVQRIYTGPGGLLESQPHLAPSATPQSMCRTPNANPALPDVNVCVGCTPSCPDVDLEKAYWESVDDPHVRWVHHGFLGLVWGFYTYYWAYSGNWGYYLSGVWTHETTTWTTLTGPGFALAALAWVPKWAAAPLFVGAWVAATGLAGVGLERLATHWGQRLWPALDVSTLRHRGLIVSAWLSINSFYLFGGRPTVMLMPTAVGKAIDIALITLTTLWLVRAWAKQRSRYRKESVLVQMHKKLQAFPIPFERLLDGRAPTQLNADEADVLVRTLPAQAAVSQKDILRQAVARAHDQHQLDSPETQRQLEDLRVLLGATPEELTVLLAEFGWTASSGADSYAAFSAIADNWLRLDNHRMACEAVLLPAWQPGHTLAELASQPQHLTRLRSLQAGSGIDDDEHQRTLALVTGLSGTLAEQAMQRLARLTDWAVCHWQLSRALHAPQTGHTPHTDPTTPPAPTNTLAWPLGPWLVHAVQRDLAPLVQADLLACVARLAALSDTAQARAKLMDAASVVPEAAWADTLAHPTLAPLRATLGQVLSPLGVGAQAEGHAIGTAQPTAWARALAQAAQDSPAQCHQRLLRCAAATAWHRSLAWHASRGLGWTTAPWPVHTQAAPTDTAPTDTQPSAQWLAVVQATQPDTLGQTHHLAACVWLRQLPVLASADWPTLDALAQHSHWASHPAAHPSASPLSASPLPTSAIWLDTTAHPPGPTTAQPPQVQAHGLAQLFAPMGTDGTTPARRQTDLAQTAARHAAPAPHPTVLVVDRAALQATVQAHAELGARWLQLINTPPPPQTAEMAEMAEMAETAETAEMKTGTGTEAGKAAATAATAPAETATAPESGAAAQAAPRALALPQLATP